MISSESQQYPKRLDVIALTLGAAAFLPGARVTVLGVEPLFYVVELIGVLAIGWAVVRFRRGLGVPVPGTTWATLFLWVVLVITSLIGIDAFRSLGIARVSMLATGLAWAIPSLPIEIDRWRAAGVAAAGGVTILLLQIVIQLHSVTEGSFDVTSNVRSTVTILGGSLNGAAALMLMTIPFLLIGVLRASGLLRGAMLAAIMAASWATWVSESRGIVYAFLITAAAWVVSILVDSEQRALLRGAKTAVAVALLLGSGLGATSATTYIAWGISTGSTRVVALVDAIGSEVDTSRTSPTGPALPEPVVENPEDTARRNTTSDRWRIAFYEAAWNDFEERPLVGLGFRVRSTPYGIQSYAHNAILEVLAATGIIGGLAYATLLSLYVFRWRRRRSGQLGVVIVAGGGLIAGGFIAMVHPFLNTSHMFAVMWWLLLALPIPARLNRRGASADMAVEQPVHEQVA